jgi:hypothetical protein
MGVYPKISIAEGAEIYWSQNRLGSALAPRRSISRSYSFKGRSIEKGRLKAVQIDDIYRMANSTGTDYPKP